MNTLKTDIKRALERGADWRLLVLFVLGVLVPSSFLLMPVHGFLQTLLDHSPRAPSFVKALDSAALTEVVRQLEEPVANGIGPGLRDSLLVTAFLAPALAGATVHVASGERGRERGQGYRGLLRAAGELYPRMLRMAVVSVLPLGVAAGLSALAFQAAGRLGAKTTLESSASHATLAATVVAVLLVWLANLTVEAGRAWFAAEPDRTSAFGAWWSGVRLLVRRPGAMLGVGAAGTVVGLGLATLLTALRLRLVITGEAGIALGFVIAQLAVAALAWGRASRMAGMAEIARLEP